MATGPVTFAVVAMLAAVVPSAVTKAVEFCETLLEPSLVMVITLVTVV
jgi:hypothetical protein